MKVMVLKRSNTTRFILPLIGLDKDKVITSDFIGSFIRIDCLPEVENSLILVYTSENREVKILAIHFQIVEQYHIYIIENNGILCDTINKFIKGKYSTFSPLSKNTILKFWGLDKNSKLSNILYPNTYMFENNGRLLLTNKPFEIWPPPDMDKETFKLAL